MKRCPTCHKTYADESLNFCLDDGTSLLAGGGTSSHDSGATLILPQGISSIAAPPHGQSFDPRGAPTEHMPATAATVPQRPRYTAPDAHIAAPPPKSRSHLLTAGITAIAVLLLVLVGIGIALLIRGRGEDQSSVAKTNDLGNSNGPPAAPSSNSASKTNTNNQTTAVPSSSTDSHAHEALRTTATASSTRVPLKAFTYLPSHVLDQSFQTAWIEGVPGPGVGEWIRCDFDREVKLNHVVITPGYFKNAKIWRENNRLGAATLHFSDGSSRRFSFPDLMQEQTLDTGGIRTRFVRLVIEESYPGSVDSEDTPISQIKFDWEP